MILISISLILMQLETWCNVLALFADSPLLSLASLSARGSCEEKNNWNIFKLIMQSWWVKPIIGEISVKVKVDFSTTGFAINKVVKPPVWQQSSNWGLSSPGIKESTTVVSLTNMKQNRWKTPKQGFRRSSKSFKSVYFWKSQFAGAWMHTKGLQQLCNQQNPLCSHPFCKWFWSGLNEYLNTFYRVFGALGNVDHLTSCRTLSNSISINLDLDPTKESKNNPVGGWTTHLKNIFVKNWLPSPPKIEVKHQKTHETTTQPLVVYIYSHFMGFEGWQLTIPLINLESLISYSIGPRTCLRKVDSLTISIGQAPWHKIRSQIHPSSSRHLTGIFLYANQPNQCAIVWGSPLKFTIHLHSFIAPKWVQHGGGGEVLGTINHTNLLNHQEAINWATFKNPEHDIPLYIFSMKTMVGSSGILTIWLVAFLI